LSLSELLNLAPGDALLFDYPATRKLDGLVQGVLKFRGQVVGQGRRRAFLIEELIPAGS
jgi:flagellar motor switch protein FliM